jgi:hypothetical protein
VRVDVNTVAQLFDAIWAELVSMLGTTATATLIRRAVKRACVHNSELCKLTILREGWEYRYRLPSEWENLLPEEVPAFSKMVISELVPLLREFTGQIVLRRLGRVPMLQGLGFAEEEK